jgi:hypothetical protein
VARRRSTVTADDGLGEIEAWYRDQLTRPAEVITHRWPPVLIGPTWQLDGEHWLLPERTLGWGVLAWCGRWLQLRHNVPWRFTLEQARFLLWWYSLEESGEFTYRDGVLQRLKGWGKDPLGACLCMAELLGPVRFGGFEGGGPVGIDVPDAWVQTAAVSLEQTKNTMRLLPGLITAEARSRYRIAVGKEQVYALGDLRLFQAVTSSPATLEGARATFILPNETQHWTASNAGHDMAAVLERNATKSTDGAARTLRITNAYEPGQDSVAERDREAWEATQAALKGTAGSVGLLYDSVEAHPDAPLSAEAAPEVVAAIRGDSVWLSIARIVQSILDVRNPASRSRRFWYNQITAAEDAWTTKQAWESASAPDQLVLPGEPIVAFLDGSKSDDATGIVGCRLSDGHLFTIGVWVPDRETKIVPLAEVSTRVDAMFASYDVVAFWGDPSDVRDDSGERFWEPSFDDWHQRYGPQLKFWAVRAGDQRHAVSWDMRSPERQQEFTAAAERFIAELGPGGGSTLGRITHDGNRVLKTHVLNARRRPNRWGVTLGKEHRESRRKIDLAVCAVGARMLRRAVLNKDTGGTPPRSGKVW